MPTIPSQAGDATREIHHFLRAKFPGICVDIMDDTFARPFQFFPVSRSDEIFGKWNGICAKILSTLGLSEFLSIACYRYDVRESATENPVTVILSIRKQSTREWTTATHQVREVLDQFGVCDVDILFLMDERWR